MEKPLQTPEDANLVVQEVLDNVHPWYCKNSHVLLGKLWQHKHIFSWDNQGSFAHKGDVIKESISLVWVGCVP